MSSPKIQRGIQSRHARKIGDAPVVGKVSKFRNPESGTYRSRSQRRTEAALAKRRTAILLASIILGLITLSVLGVFLGLWFKSRRATGTVDSSAPPRPETIRLVSKFPSPSEDQAVAVVKQALAIQKEADISEVIHPGKASPSEIVGFLTSAEERDGTLDNITWLSSMDVEDLLIEGVMVSYLKDGKASVRLAMLVPDEQGVWKMDFDAFARSCRPSWKEIVASKAVEAEVRVFVAKDSYFNGPFANESEWICYAMASPDTAGVLPEDKDLLRGYCKVGSRQAKAMTRILNEENRIGRATLMIRREKDADSRQFLITRVLANDWVIGPTLLDKKVQ